MPAAVTAGLFISERVLRREKLRILERHPLPVQALRDRDSRSREGKMTSNYGRERNTRKQRERTRRAREQFMIFVLLLALVPTIFCVVLFTKQAQLQKELDSMEQKLEQYEKKPDSQGGGQNGLPTTLTPAPTPTPEASLAGPGAGGDAGGQAGGEPSPEPTGAGMVMTGESGISPSAEPTPTESLEDNNEPSPTPTLAVDPVTGELLPWAEKKIYLTFDDGPSKYTDELLDLLNEYGVKVTFFVNGRTDDDSLRLYKRIVDEGHSIGMHSYSHKYEEVYKSVEDFEKDFTKISDLLYDTIGYVPDLYRFPGGSSNSKCKKLTIQPFISFLLEHDMRYFDWNVENGDATGVSYTVEQLAQNVLDGVKNKTTSVVLCHDTNAKQKTLESMKILIPALQEKGAQILPITEDTPMVRHVTPAEE